MAFQMDYVNNDNGADVSDAYWCIAIDKYCQYSSIEFYIGVKRTSESIVALTDSLDHYVVKTTDPNFDNYFSIETLSIEGNNMIAQAYKYLKAEVDKFSGAVGV